MRKFFKSPFLFAVLVCLLVSGFVGLVSATSYTITLATGSGGNAWFYYNNNPDVYYRVGSHTVASGSVITFYTGAAGGYIFSHWDYSGWASGETSVNPLTVTVAGSFSLTANFVPTTVSFDVTLAAGTGGSITGTVGTASYGVGTYSFQSGTQLVLTGVPDSGYVFKQFTEIGMTNPTIITVVADTTITAEFEAVGGNVYFVNCTGDAGGSVRLDYDGGSTGVPVHSVGDGVYQVEYESTCRFTAVPESGYGFTDFEITGDWTGVVANSFFDFVVDGNITVVAHFEITDTGLIDNGAGVLDFRDLNPYAQLFLLFLVMFAPALVVVVLIPKVGFTGFVGMLAFSLAFGVLLFHFPFWLLIFVGLGLALMLFNLMNRG